MSGYQERRRCNKVGCGKPSVFDLGIWTDEGHKTVSFCLDHALFVGRVVDSVVEGLVGATDAETL